MINWLKVVAINLTDFANEIRPGPFVPFTRDLVPPQSGLSLDVKASDAETLLKDFEIAPGLYQYILPARGGPIDLGDQALWQGITTAMWAFKYAVTQDPEDAKTLGRAVSAMTFHQPGGRLIRGVIPGTTTSLDDASNDSASGHLAGLHFASIYGDVYSKSLATGLLDRWSASVIPQAALLSPLGQPTPFGALLQGSFTDPLRLTLYLALMRSAGQLGRYNAALKAFRPLVRYPKVRLWSWDTDYDTHRAALHLSILLDLETDPAIRADYLAGLTRIWRMVRFSANPWVGFLIARHLPGLIEPDVRSLQIVLSECDPLTKSRGNVERINSKDADLWRSRGVQFVSYGGHLRATQPLPPWLRPNQDFFWQRNQYDVDGWVGNTSPDVRYTSVDFLAAWWLACLVIKEQKGNVFQ
jgi:hypothetical protein